MQIYGLQKLTLLDFPQKTACTIFTGGCNFRCPFCHNGDLVLGDFPEAISIDELFSFLKKRVGILDGVCITGGEPLLNPDIDSFIKEIRNMGYLVKLDTNGSNPECLKRLVEQGLVDYVAMDIKNSKEAYPETVGIENYNVSPICESVEFLKKSDTDYEFRTTIVKEFHTEDDIMKIGEWLKDSKKYFLQNFVDSESVIRKGLHSVDETDLKRWKDILTGYIDFVEIRGI